MFVAADLLLAASTLRTPPAVCAATNSYSVPSKDVDDVVEGVSIRMALYAYSKRPQGTTRTDQRQAPSVHTQSLSNHKAGASHLWADATVHTGGANNSVQVGLAAGVVRHHTNEHGGSPAHVKQYYDS